MYELLAWTSRGGTTMSRRCSKQYDAENLVMNFIALLLVLPFIGVYFLCRPEREKKVLGGVLFGIGLAIWLVMSCGS